MQPSEESPTDYKQSFVESMMTYIRRQKDRRRIKSLRMLKVTERRVQKADPLKYPQDAITCDFLGREDYSQPPSSNVNVDILSS